MEVHGKVALLTGGARIGQAVAEALAARGCAVALTYRGSRDAAERTVAEIQAAGGRAIALKTDVTDTNQIRDTVAETARTLGRLDVLVNMASLYVRTSIDRLNERDWTAALDVDARSAFLFSLHAAPHMRKAGAGRIVNVSDWLSASGRPRYRDYTPYYVAKSAVLGLTQTLALELAPTILVNAIAPGPILPPGDMDADEVAKVAAATPLGRWGGAAEVAKAVVFLIETDFVTGECIRIDGGRHLS